MGIDYDAVGGYGIGFKEEDLTEETIKKFEYKDWEENMEYFLYDDNLLQVETSGNYFSGDKEYWIMLKDPLNKLEETLKYLNDLKILNKNITKEDICRVAEPIIW